MVPPGSLTCHSMCKEGQIATDSVLDNDITLVPDYSPRRHLLPPHFSITELLCSYEVFPDN